MRDQISFLHASLSMKIEKIQMEVDKSVGQFFTGSIPWSPTIQVHRDRIDYWHRVLRIKTGALTSKNAIKKLSIKIGEYSGHYLSSLACLDKLKLAWKEYRAAKKVAWSLRETFLLQKIVLKAEDRNRTTEKMEKNRRREQQSIQEGRESKQIRGRDNKQPVLKAEITDFVTGITRTVYTQEEIVIAAAESNL